MPQRILVPVDGSEEAFNAAQYAIRLAATLKAELSVLNVILLPEYITQQVSNRLEKELRSRGEEAFGRIREAAHASNVAIKVESLTTRKSVVTTICEFANSHTMQLIVTGTRGASGVANLMLGSVATGVAREARCPVLLVR